jgi:methylated-DNA-protein-cysteine methyltransferase related protein
MASKARPVPRGGLDFEAFVIEQVREIPTGQVSTYGDIARRAPRRVGYVLATTREEIPWHRVVRWNGTAPMGSAQLELLRREGVPMKGDRVDLLRARYTSSGGPPA